MPETDNRQDKPIHCRQFYGVHKRQEECLKSVWAAEPCHISAGWKPLFLILILIRWPPVLLTGPPVPWILSLSLLKSLSPRSVPDYTEIITWWVCSTVPPSALLINKGNTSCALREHWAHLDLSLPMGSQHAVAGLNRFLSFLFQFTPPLPFHCYTFYLLLLNATALFTWKWRSVGPGYSWD